MRRVVRVDIIAVLVLLCIAAFFRFYRLHEVPMGLWRDEAANGLEALRILNGDHGIFFGTREPMFIYLVAVSVAFLGRNPLAIRVVAAIVGTATIPVTYFLVKELFRSTNQSPRVTACLTSLWLATSYWHINFSRLGLRGVLLPLLASLSFYFLWRGWNRLTGASRDNPSQRFPTVVWFAISGLCFGLTLYSYTPGRFLPVVLLPFLSYIVAGRWRRELLPTSTSLLRACAVFGLSFLLVFAPLGMYFLTDAGSLFARSGVSVFRASQDEPIPILLGKNTLRQLAMFGFTADPNTRHDPAARPAFDLFTLSFFLIGVAFSLLRWREIPYLFALSWFSVMLLPAILTFPELPHFLRAIGTLPVAYIFPALGVERVWQWLRVKQVSFKLRHAFAGLMALSLTLIAIFTYRDYFAPVVEKIELIKAFDPRFVEAASIMNQFDEPDSVWLIPLGPNGEQRMAYFVIDFLYQGEAPHRYVPLDEATVAQELSDVCQGHERALVLNTTEEYLAQPWFDLYADSEGLIPFLLDKHSHRLERIDFDQLEVLVYQLPENPNFSIADEFESLEVDFGRELRLTGATCAVGYPPLSDAWVVLRWKTKSVPQRDYRVEMTFVDGQGREVGETDKLLLSNERQPTSDWEAGQEEIDYYTLSSLPEMALAEYSIEVLVYDPDAGDGLSAASGMGTHRQSFALETISLSETSGVLESAYPAMIQRARGACSLAEKS
jgi:4-amino-4-deoxy-L-arabinose transferase-like glycosyltransferase